MTKALIKSDSIGVESGIGIGILLLVILSFQIPVSIIIKGVATARTSPPRKINISHTANGFFSFWSLRVFLLLFLFFFPLPSFYFYFDSLLLPKAYPFPYDKNAYDKNQEEWGSVYPLHNDNRPKTNEAIISIKNWRRNGNNKRNIAKCCS
jgi:hypothetical protein